MAKEIEIENVKKKKIVMKIIIIIVIILLLGGGITAGFVTGGFAKLWDMINGTETKEVVEVKELDNLKEYKYVLTDKDSEFFKKEFEVLKEILNQDTIDEEAYVKQVARMFVIDLYTLNTRMNKYDVGGMEYFHVNKKTMFEQKVMDTLYSMLLDNTYGDRKQSLPEVNGLEDVSIEKTKYTLVSEKDKKEVKTEVDAYLVKLKINYVTDMGYDKEASIVVIRENNGPRWSIVDFQPTLNPKYK